MHCMGCNAHHKIVNAKLKMNGGECVSDAGLIAAKPQANFAPNILSWLNGSATIASPAASRFLNIMVENACAAEKIAGNFLHSIIRTVAVLSIAKQYGNEARA